MAHEASTPEIGSRLAAARLQRGLTQSDVAQRAEIAPSYLSRVENGKVHPTFGTALQIARGIGVGLGEVLGEEPRAGTRGPCPVTRRGKCLLDLIVPTKRGDRFTPREVRLIRSFVSWVEDAEPARLRAMEILLEDLAAGGASRDPGG